MNNNKNYEFDIDIEYNLGQGGEVSISLNGKNYFVDILEFDDDNNQIGSHYLELTSDKLWLNSQINDIYNINSIPHLQDANSMEEVEEYTKYLNNLEKNIKSEIRNFVEDSVFSHLEDE